MAALDLGLVDRVPWEAAPEGQRIPGWIFFKKETLKVQNRPPPCAKR